MIKARDTANWVNSERLRGLVLLIRRLSASSMLNKKCYFSQEKRYFRCRTSYSHWLDRSIAIQEKRSLEWASSICVWNRSASLGSSKRDLISAKVFTSSYAIECTHSDWWSFSMNIQSNTFLQHISERSAKGDIYLMKSQPGFSTIKYSSPLIFACFNQLKN